MERENVWQGFYQGGCRFFVLLGMFLCLRTFLGADVGMAALGMTAAVLAMAAEVMGLGKIEKLVLCLLFLAFLCFVAAGYWEYLWMGAKSIGNRILELANAHFRTSYLLWYLEAEEPGKSLFFFLLCVILGFLHILAATAGWGRRMRLFSQALVPLLLAVSMLSLGKAPAAGGFILALIGLAAGQAEPARRGMRTQGACIYLCLGLAILFAGSPLAGQFLERCHWPWLQRQLHFEDFMLDTLEKYTNLRLFANDGVQDMYRLGNGEPDITEREAFQITLKQRPKGNIYLKGFVGGDYEDGNWRGVSLQAFSDWAQQQGYSLEDYQQLVREYPYESAKFGYQAQFYQEDTMDLKLRRSTRGYTLTPYFADIPAAQDQEADGALMPLKQREFQWKGYFYMEDAVRFLSHNLIMYAPSARMSSSEPWQGDGQRRHARLGNAMYSYGEYAMQAYTRLPLEGLESLRAFAVQEEKDMPGIVYKYKPPFGQVEEWAVDLFYKNETEKKIRLVQELLWEDTEYSLALSPVPAGEDFAEYFLFGQKKGYCTHYATAATLLLRLYGVPARYVMGYLVLPSDFKENADGSYTAVITDERGHAWTEVYHDNIGFCPIEMTPPSYTEMLKALPEGKGVKAALEEREKKKAEEAQKAREEREEAKKQEESKRQEEEQKKSQAAGNGRNPAAGSGIMGQILRIAAVASVFLILAALLAMATYLLREHRLRKRRERFDQPNRKKAVQFMARRMSWILSLLGCRREDSMGDREYAAVLQAKITGIDWLCAVDTLQKAFFSSQEITEEEYQQICALYGGLEERLRQEKGKVRKFFYDMCGS